MQIIRPTIVQKISFIPRMGKLGTKIIVHDENANKDYNMAPTFQRKGYRVEAIGIFPIVEGNFYTISVYDNTDVIFLDRLFCTSQDIETFSINDGVYNANQTENEFIVQR